MGASEKHDAAYHGTESDCTCVRNVKGARLIGNPEQHDCPVHGYPVTAQPKPTAADVLREHGVTNPRGGVALCATCGEVFDNLLDRNHLARVQAQHQADMLAAAGLLATAEHDQAVIDEYRANLPKADDLGLTIWGADTLAEHDAQVRADAITEVWDQAREAIRVATSERDELRRRIDRVLAECDRAEEINTRSVGRTFDGGRFPVTVPAEIIRDVINRRP